MSNALPSNLALSTINTDDPVASAPLRNNFAATQTGVNQVISCLSGGSLGQVLEAVDNSDVQWAYPPGYEIGYDQITATVSVVGTTLAGATSIIPGSSHAFDGNPVMAEFFAPWINTPSATAGNSLIVVLVEGGTNIAQSLYSTPSAASLFVAGNLKFRFTPTAGAHTYSIKAYATNTTGTPQVGAGTGVAGAAAPAYLRFTKV